MNRRHFLHVLAASTPLLAGPVKLFAATGTDTRFLLVFLRGGYDATHILVPYSSTLYYETRPGIAVARPDPADPNAALPINADWALHPALKNSIWPLFQQGHVAFIPFAGTDTVSRSHFETQDRIELGQPSVGHKNYSSGFLNRLVSTVSGPVQAISFTDSLPLVGKGPAAIANLSLKGQKRPVFADRQADILAELYQGSGLNEYVKQGFALNQAVTEDLAAEMEQASRGALASQGFEKQAQRMAVLMKDSFNIAFVDVGGWDTHFNQGAAQGQLANKIAALGAGLNAFAKEMGPLWQKTVVLVISEFGRTFRENGNRGTDHGHGTVYWVLGGGIKGGRIVGDQTQLTAGTLFEGRDYPVLNENRSVIGGLFQAQFGLSETAVERIFPSARPKNLGLI